MSTTFHVPLNNAVAKLASPHTANSGTLVLDDATAFGSPSPSAPVRVTAKLSNSTFVIYSITGKSSNTLTVGSVIEGTTDVDLPTNTVIEDDFTAGHLQDAYTAINTLETTVAGLGSGSGTVTSVGLVLPALFTVTGTPVTTTGTLTAALASQSANRVFASPSGSSGAPTFRAMTSADIPNIAQSQVTNLVSDLAAKADGATVAHSAGDETWAGVKTFTSQIVGSVSGTAANVTGTVAIANGGTGQTSAANAINALVPTQTSNNGKFLTTNGTVVSWATVSGGAGTVTSVALTLPSIFTVSGSPVTGAGTLAGTLASQSANTIFAAPDGSSGAPTFRAMLAADVPSLNASKITAGVPAGVLKGSGGVFAAAVAGTDYLTPSGSGAALTGITASAVGYTNTASGLVSTNTQAALDELNTLIASSGNGTRLISGGGVAWVSGYIFRVSSATYYINNAVVNSAQQDVTLAAADVTNPRFDAIVLDNTGAATSVTGVAAPSPSLPVVDPQTQLAVSYVRVDANTSTPATISSVVVYTENAEWTGTATAGSIVFNSTANPYGGTVSIEGTSVPVGVSATLLNGSLIDPSSFGYLVLYIKSKGAFSKRSLVLSFLATNVQKGTTVTLADGTWGFASSQVSTYQQIVIPLTQFSIPGGTTINQFRMTMTGSGANVGFFIDNISLQGNASSTNPSYLTQDQGDSRYTRRSLNLSDVSNTVTSLNNLLPSQTSNSGKFLTTNGGGSVSWAVATLGTQPQINSHYGVITSDTDGSTITFDCATSDKHTVTLGGNRTLAFTNDQIGQTIMVILKQDATGSRTITAWPTGVLWSGGTTPTLTTTANKRDVFTFVKTASGEYLGFISGLNY